jgi:anti-sigma factor RsiW
MHGSTRDQLEDVLASKRDWVPSSSLSKHLASCGECASELESMRLQSELLRSLRPPSEMEPPPGFYARVLQRIEDHARTSIWAGFIYSPFGKRLAFASLSLALLLGVYVIAEEKSDTVPDQVIAAQQWHYDAPVVGSQAQQRDAVLVNFVSHQGSGE